MVCVPGALIGRRAKALDPASDSRGARLPGPWSKAGVVCLRPAVGDKNEMSATQPREGMMAVVRNRRAMIIGVQPFDADEFGRL